MSAGAVEVWQAGPGSWRWRYVEPPTGAPGAGAVADLPSATDHSTREAAVSAARTAYPDAVVRLEAPVGDDDGQPRGCRRRVVRGLALVLLAGAVAAVLRGRIGSRSGRRVSS